MCLAVYLGTSQPVPTRPWREGESIGIAFIPRGPATVRALLATTHAYELLAWEGCGCGFERGRWPAKDDEERERERRNAASTEALTALLREILGREPRAVLYACWMGDEGREIVSQRTLPLAFFEQAVVQLPERERLSIEP